MSKFSKTFDFIKSLYPDKEEIHLHEPTFVGNEDAYVRDCIKTTMVSSVGEFVTRFEKEIATTTGRKFAASTSSGTTALSLALELAGVEYGDEVLTQALTFVATSNAISHVGAFPVYLDVSEETMGLSAKALKTFLKNEATKGSNGKLINKKTSRRIGACLPVHVMGHPCEITEILEICREFDLPVVEDAAEALGSEFQRQQMGSFGLISAFSFNGNKIVTTGGGGALVMDDQALYTKAKALSTTAKRPHKWDFYHDEVAYNYRMPNINAALGCAQMESFPTFLKDKRKTAGLYKEFFASQGIKFFEEPKDSKSNYWLNTLIMNSLQERDEFLNESHEQKIYCRPLWHLMTELPMYKNAQTDDLKVSKWFRDRVVNLPSGVREGK